jgi:hypothetical protein
MGNSSVVYGSALAVLILTNTEINNTKIIAIIDVSPKHFADPGYGIRCFFDPWIRWGKNPDPASGMNILDYNSNT